MSLLSGDEHGRPSLLSSGRIMNSAGSTLRRGKCLLFGTLDSHSTMGRVAACKAAGFAVDLVHIGHVSAPDFDFRRFGECRLLGTLDDPFVSGPGRFARERESLRTLRVLREDRAVCETLSGFIRESTPQVVVVHYGSLAIHFSRLVKRMYPSLPVVDILNLIPTAVRELSESRRYRLSAAQVEHLSYSRWLHRLEGVICAAPDMLAHVRKKYGVPHGRSCVLADFLPRSFLARKVLDGVHVLRRADDRPHVIHLASPLRWGGRIDALDDHYMEIADAGVHVFAGTLSDEAKRNNLLHDYPAFSEEQVARGDLAAYAAQFDAVMVAYQAQPQERFRTTLPTRFFSALTVGIPIAVRGGLLDACERFVDTEKNGFVYADGRELCRVLRDVSALDRMKREASQRLNVFTAEAQGPALRAFLDRVIAQSRATGAYA